MSIHPDTTVCGPSPLYPNTCGCGAALPPTSLELGQVMAAALLAARDDLRFKSYGEVLDVMHAALEAYADNHAWSSRLAWNCERFIGDVR